MSIKNSKARTFFAEQATGIFNHAHYMLATALLLTACGGDSGSNSNSSGPVPVDDPLPECNKSLESTTMYVEKEHKYYTCSNNMWTLVEDSNKNSSSATENKEKKDDPSESTEIDEYDINSWESAEDGTIRPGKSIGELYKYDEAAQQWILANMYDTLYGLEGCTQSKYKMAAEGNDGSTYVCDNEWSQSEFYPNRWKWRLQTHTEVATGVICSYSDIGDYQIFITSMECLGRGVWKALQETVNEEALIDPRDEHVYKTVGIGTQIWMAENLNYESPDSRCYNDSTEYCNQYGRLYTWGAAMDSIRTGCGYGDSCSVTGNDRGICPEGWHLPNENEWRTLDETVNDLIGSITGKALKASSGWDKSNDKSGNGSDFYGFSALPSGLWIGIGSGSYQGIGTETCYWLSNEGDFLDVPTATYAPEKLANTRLEKARRVLIANNREDNFVSSVTKYDACAVRCLKD